jgi:hypothetical protein
MGNLFLVCDSPINIFKEVWLLDSGCRNHMIGNKASFVKIDESTNSEVLLGDHKPL